MPEHRLERTRRAYTEEPPQVRPEVVAQRTWTLDDLQERLRVAALREYVQRTGEQTV